MTVAGPGLMAMTAAAAVLAWPSRRRPTLGRPRAGHPRTALRGRRRPPVLALPTDLVMELVACGLRAGLSVPAALSSAARSTSGPDADSAMAGVVARLGLGLSARAAWQDPPADLVVLARALVLAELSGAPAAAVVSRAADELRAERREAGEQAAARLGVRLVLPLGLAVLPGFLLLAVAPTVLGLASSVLSTAR